MTLWDFTDKTSPRRLGEPLYHIDVLMELAFAPDMRTLATSHTHGTIILWSLTAWEAPRRLGQPIPAHTGTVWTVSYARDGLTLATGADDGTAILWDLSDLIDLQTRAIERACALTGSGLTPTEWIRYISGLPYQNTCE